MKKSDLRQELLAQRRAMDRELCAAKSSELVKGAMGEIRWRRIKTMHCFLPLQHDNEPDMRALIAFAMDRDVAVFTTDPAHKTGRQVQHLRDGYHQSQLHQFTHMGEQVLDIIIVPMLAYDSRTHHRLGFGGGFYDRLLASQPQAHTIGVCFREFEMELPVEAHDQPLDTIIIA